MFYSKATRGFYDSGIHGENMPADVVEVSADDYAALLAAQSEGLEIVPDASGFPIAVSPPISVPHACTPAQGLVALFVLKRITEDDVFAAISQIADPVQQYTAKIGYQHAAAWERSSPTMQTMAQLLQLSGQDLDELFTYAVTVQV